jgi:phage-related tail protein
MDDDQRAPIEQFLRDAEDVYEEYDAGYTDADAALRVLRSHLDRLREQLEP